MVMKELVWAAFLLFSPLGILAQIDTVKSAIGAYYFDGDDVVFEFDRRAYAAAFRTADSARVDFADLDVLQVAVSGNFNGWSQEGWKMERVDENRFRLRKHLRDFTDAPDWQFKFLINGQYWTVVSGDPKKQGALGWYDLNNPDAPAPQAGDSGNVVFRLKGFIPSKRVVVTGSFNNWDENALEMKRSADGWELTLTLKPGVYEYKFIADGQWLHDPANPERRHNQYGTYNSLLRVTTPVRFELEGFREAREVILTGNFNNWDEKAVKMRRTEFGWAAELPLAGGKHLYKFIVDGGWMTDPANPRIETDPHGNVNSVLFVR